MADFERIFTENRDFIYKYLLKLSRDSSVAEELTQETFFRGYVNIASLRDEAKVSTWLCSIAKNAYFAWCKENKSKQELDEQRAFDSTDLADFFIEKELSSRAYECVHELDEPYKEVFMLSVFCEMSLKDISRLFGKSESWARVTFYRAKCKIIEKMGKR